MEEKLAEFKSRKRRERLVNQSTAVFNGILDMFPVRSPSRANDADSSVNSPLLVSSRPTSPSLHIQSDDEISIASSNTSSIDLSCKSISGLQWVTYGLYFLLWVTLYLIAIQLEFGYVYVVVSSLFFIYFNTRTGPRKVGEVSAYSVFNPNCEAIDGTLNAEQFEREFNLIKHDPASPKK